MTILNSIQLRNIRRFGQEVTIRFGPGVTVLLAPNGTGKTAIFEGIELGLTGTVARLQESLDPLIRDSEPKAQVILTFENEQRRVDLARGGSCIIQGQIPSVLGEVESKDLPYLLRLTHLLDQRDGSWFVQAGSEDAGSQLARLPIGRDVTVASAALSSARKTQRNRLETERVKSEASKSLQYWRGLIAERDLSSQASGKPLTPLDELESMLKSFSNQSWSSISTSVGPSLDSLTSDCAELITRLERHIAELRTREASLSELGEIHYQYESAVLGHQAAVETLKGLMEELANAKLQSAKASAALIEVEESRLRLEEKRQPILERQRLLQSSDEATADLTAKEASLKLSQTLFDQAKHQAELSRINLETKTVAYSTHQTRERRIQEAIRDETEILSDLERLGRMLRLQIELEAHQSELMTQSSAASNLQILFDQLSVSAGKWELETRTASEAFKIISDTSDSIRTAVSTIASKLPKDRGDCPVCGVDHGPGGLQARISQALAALDPALGPANEHLKFVETEASKAKLNLEKTRQDFRKQQEQVEQISQIILVIMSEITEITQRLQKYGSNPGEIKVNIDSVASKLSASRLSLEAERSAAAQDISEEVLVELTAISHAASAALETAHSRFEVAKLAFGRSKENAERVIQALSQFSPIVDTGKEVEELEIALRESMVLIERRKLEKDRWLDTQINLEHRLPLAERSVASAHEGVVGYQSRWSSNLLPSSPSKDTLDTERSNTQSELDKSLKARHFLGEAQVEFSRYQALAYRENCQRKLDALRGSAKEEDFTAQLELNLSNADAELNRVNRALSALESLSEGLRVSLSDVHEQVKLIEPKWRALLNRVIREPRFSRTELDFYSHYKKEHAEVKVPLHGSTAPARMVASEAQIADLQLTFLLAMALEKPWSPWRALLLDDPTQHHDLVHASAVFDLLRDFVDDHQFQILFATHDALQARFILRKMRNDGVPARLCELRPTQSGVQAIQDDAISQ